LDICITENIYSASRNKERGRPMKRWKDQFQEISGVGTD
jgi:hypothetical protein